jgi:hypothetical protein
VTKFQAAASAANPAALALAEDPGLGLWLTHQLDIDVALIHGDDGFTIRLRAGTITS